MGDGGIGSVTRKYNLNTNSVPQTLSKEPVKDVGMSHDTSAQPRFHVIRSIAGSMGPGIEWKANANNVGIIKKKGFGVDWKWEKDPNPNSHVYTLTRNGGWFSGLPKKLDNCLARKADGTTTTIHDSNARIIWGTDKDVPSPYSTLLNSEIRTNQVALYPDGSVWRASTGIRKFPDGSTWKGFVDPRSGDPIGPGEWTEPQPKWWQFWKKPSEPIQRAYLNIRGEQHIFSPLEGNSWAASNPEKTKGFVAKMGGDGEFKLDTEFYTDEQEKTLEFSVDQNGKWLGPWAVKQRHGELAKFTGKESWSANFHASYEEFSRLEPISIQNARHFGRLMRDFETKGAKLNETRSTGTNETIAPISAEIIEASLQDEIAQWTRFINIFKTLLSQINDSEIAKEIAEKRLTHAQEKLRDAQGRLTQLEAIKPNKH